MWSIKHIWQSVSTVLMLISSHNKTLETSKLVSLTEKTNALEYCWNSDRNMIPSETLFFLIGPWEYRRLYYPWWRDWELSQLANLCAGRIYGWLWDFSQVLLRHWKVISRTLQNFPFYEYKYRLLWREIFWTLSVLWIKKYPAVLRQAIYPSPWRSKDAWT